MLSIPMLNRVLKTPLSFSLYVLLIEQFSHKQNFQFVNSLFNLNYFIVSTL